MQNCTCDIFMCLSYKQKYKTSVHVTVLGLVFMITIPQFSHNRLLVNCCGRKVQIFRVVLSAEVFIHPSVALSFCCN